MHKTVFTVERSRELFKLSEAGRPHDVACGAGTKRHKARGKAGGRAGDELFILGQGRMKSGGEFVYYHN